MPYYNPTETLEENTFSTMEFHIVLPMQNNTAQQ